jgi:ribosomal protein S14
MSTTFTRETRVSTSNPCRVCGHPDWCVTFPDDWTLCQRTESDRFCETTGGHFHWTGQGNALGDWRDRPYAPPRATIAPDVAEGPTIDPVIRRRGLEAILTACPLSDAHRAALIGRGLTAEAIARHGYGSLPGDWAGRRTVARAVIAACGDVAYGQVPGLFRDGQGAMIAGVTGVLIPSRDLAGDIQGLRLRPDDPGDGGKYRWLSSPTMSGGAGSGAPTHVAMPATPPATITRVMATEGELKANIAAERLGIPVVAMAGATITRDVLPMVLALGATEVVLAFDADRLTNEHVGRADRRLGDELAAAGLTVYRATWAGTAKGIDDALAAGATIVFEPARPAADAACLAELATVRRERDEARASLSAITQTIMNPHLKATEKVAIVAASGLMQQKRARGEVEPDGSVVLSAAEVSDDYRPVPQRGEHVAPRNLSGSTPRMTRGSVKPILETMIARGIVPATPRHAVKTRAGGLPYKETTWTLPASSPADFLGPAASWRPDDPTDRKPRRVAVPCSSCGELHPIVRTTTRTDACTGCGSILDTKTITRTIVTPDTEERDQDAPGDVVVIAATPTLPMSGKFPDIGDAPTEGSPESSSGAYLLLSENFPDIGPAPSPRPVANLAPAREALAADDRPALFDALAADAEARGRTPVPKSGHRSPYDMDMTTLGGRP